MEIALLVKLGFIVKGIVLGGYSITGSYLAKTAFQYVEDYKRYNSEDK